MRTFIAMLGLALLSLVTAGPHAGRFKVHDEMTGEEVQQVFNTEPLSVPEYEVVPINWPRLHKRAQGSSTRIRLNAFGRDINLWLNPTEGILAGKDTPVYYARSDKSAKTGVRFSKINEPMTVVHEMLEDREKKASLIVKSTPNGGKRISGFVASEGWVVKPLPSRFNEDLNIRNRRSADDEPDYRNRTIGDYEPVYHVIYKNPGIVEDPPIIDDLLNSNDILHRRTRRSAPSVIYPQVMVVVDHGLYKIHGEYLYDLLEYLVPFWNGVDLRYRSLEFPKVRLNIAGIIVAKDADALSFVSDNKVSSGTLNIFGALEDLSVYMRKVESYFPVTSYDVAVAMAPYDMCAPTKSGTCRSGTLGLAYLAGACDILNYRTPKTLSVSVIQDKGGFDGMHTAAHELGHLFGAGHDGTEDSLCSAEKGHIMASTPVLTENSADWSQCSLEAFDKYINSGEPDCLFDKPKTTAPLPRVLPGRIMTMDEQCAKIEGTKACKLEEDMCMRLRCIYKKDSDYCTEVGDAAADGTTCAKGKICLHGKCLFEKDIQ